jgi:hypothetical protein
VHYFTALGKEHYCEGMLVLVNGWGKHAKDDWKNKQ